MQKLPSEAMLVCRQCGVHSALLLQLHFILSSCVGPWHHLRQWFPTYL